MSSNVSSIKYQSQYRVPNIHLKIEKRHTIRHFHVVQANIASFKVITPKDLSAVVEERADSKYGTTETSQVRMNYAC